MMRVLLTRPQPDSERIAALLPEDTEAQIWPLTRIEPMTRPVQIPPPAQALVFTSSNAVRVFAELCDVRDLPTLAVGDRTADLLHCCGFQDVRSAAGDLSDLVNLIRTSGYRNVFHPRGQDVSGDLCAALAPFDVTVADQILYAAVPTCADSTVLTAIMRGHIDLITLWSRRNSVILGNLVRGFDAAARIATPVLGLSRNAIDPLNPMMFPRVVVAEHPNTQSMIAEITALSVALRQ